MKISELKEITNQAFAHTAYVSDHDGDSGITGKFAFASYLGDGFWDVWLRNEADLAAGLSNRKVGAIIKGISSLENAPTGPLQRLEGEAVYARMPTNTFLRAAPLLGILKRRKPSGKPFTKSNVASSDVTSSEATKEATMKER